MPKATCCEDGCVSKVHAKLLCKRHYSAEYRRRNPDKVGVYNEARRKGPPATRRCVVCDREFTPNASGQVTCPPSAEERARLKQPDKAQSWCSSRRTRFLRGEIKCLKGTPPAVMRAHFACAQCGKPCRPGENVDRQATKFCSSRCKGAWHAKANPWTPPKAKRGPCCRITKQIKRVWVEGHCCECGERFIRKQKKRLDPKRAFCSRPCQAKSKARDYRIRKRGVGSKSLTFWKIADRDNWRCGLCGDPVDKDLTVPDLMAPSLDHIIPLSRGGNHAEDNVQLAHFICNSKKSDGTAVPVGGQTTLV